MDVMALLQQALDASTKLRELSKKIEDADFRMLLADLHSALADAKLESGDLKMKLAAAQERVLDLEQQLADRQAGEPSYTEEGVYSFAGESGRFCTSCWDDGKKRVRLSSMPADFDFAGKWTCPKCKACYAGAA
ncbi:hypothetical protein [Pseudomonas brassicacearum]|uniref:Uncharacterized protein n=1 Tax=Pseudomonas brassicacearum TaxID=930166 RepID=A0A423JX84_9PSED|nr:hypothetical protein [Pseudomonas brassicacearum]RON42288.1 hypothetical protein BK664_01490 [Pseudomonas brassicacearum]